MACNKSLLSKHGYRLSGHRSNPEAIMNLSLSLFLSLSDSLSLCVAVYLSFFSRCSSLCLSLSVSLSLSPSLSLFLSLSSNRLPPSPVSLSLVFESCSVGLLRTGFVHVALVPLVVPVAFITRFPAAIDENLTLCTRETILASNENCS